MITTEMDPQLTSAVRAELSAIGTKHSRLQRHQRRTRALAIGVGLVVIAAATTGAAIVVNSFPGSTTVEPLGGISAATGTGTGTLDLGPAPANAGAVILRVTCLDRQGTISVQTKQQSPGSDSFVTIDCVGRTTPVHIRDGLLPKPGSTSITITADPGTEWKATAEYASSVTSAWGVNARGQTYGACNYNGCPDLSGARATNGKDGFILTKELDAFRGNGYIKVYESDGTTVIGRFSIGVVDGGN